MPPKQRLQFRKANNIRGKKINTLQNRHGVTDKQWSKIEPIIKEKLVNWGGSNANDNRIFVNACLWIIRTGAPWRDLPPQYGKLNAAVNANGMHSDLLSQKVVCIIAKKQLNLFQRNSKFCY